MQLLNKCVKYNVYVFIYFLTRLHNRTIEGFLRIVIQTTQKYKQQKSINVAPTYPSQNDKSLPQIRLFDVRVLCVCSFSTDLCSRNHIK